MKNINIFEQLQFDLIRDDCSLSESKVSARKQYYGLICTIVFNSKSFLCKLNIILSCLSKEKYRPVLLIVYLIIQQLYVRSVLGSVHVFYFEVSSRFPHVFMLLVPLFIVSCFDWLS